MNWLALGERKKAEANKNWLNAALVAMGLTVWNALSGAGSDLILPMNLGLLATWYFVAGKKQVEYVKDLASKYERRSWLKPLGISFACLFSLVEAGNWLSPSAQISSRQSAERIYNLSGEEAIRAAKKHMVGTWTYTGPNYTFLWKDPRLPGLQEGPGWVKWVVNEDGTMIKYKASPTASGWGLGSKVEWFVTTGKFNNTGGRYYKFCPESADYLDNPALREAIIISRDGTLEYRLSDRTTTVVVERGEKFPFSK